MWVTWLAVVLSFWVVLAILQAFTGNGRCGQWLDLSGFRLCLFHLQWETTRFNRIFYRLGHGFPTMLDTWFGVGLVCSLCCMIWSVYLLCTALVHAIQIITASTSPPSTGQVLQLVVPGVNLPLEQLQFFLPALLFSAVIHEIGHAVAATRDSVGLNSCGIFLFVLYPGAFVNLHTTQLHHLSPMRQLRIYCAGVWHNMVLAIVALALLLLLPWLMLPGYQMGSGVVVTSVTKGSAMSGPLGLEVGDLVNKLGTCKVASNEDWTQCLMSSKQNVHGMCMSEELVRSLQTTATVYLRTDDIIECCDNHSLSDLCFSYSREEMTNQGKQYACLPVRKALEMAGEHPCHTHADCPALLGPSICLQATLVQPARLLILYRPPTKPVLFVGDPVHLYHTVSVSSYIPRYLLLPRGLPPFLETFLKYVVSLSGALGLLNAVPCFALDGQWILAALLESVQWPKLCPPFLFVILTLGTGLLLANLVLGIVLLVH